MNATGRVVVALLTTGVLFAVIAAARGRVDGAAALAITLIFLALAITAWASTNRKRNIP